MVTSSHFTAQFMDSAFFAGRAAFGSSPLHISLDLERPFATEELERAVSDTIGAFPILGCRYELGFWRDRWTPRESEDVSPLQDVETDEDVDSATRRLMLEELDPVSDGPWRVTQLRCPDGCRLVVTVLHMLADAAGALTVVRELGARLTGSEPHPGWKSGSMNRGLFQIIRALKLSDLRTLVAETVSFLALPFRYLRFARHKVEVSTRGEGELGGPIYRSARFDVGDGSALRMRCRELGCTINDALVAAICLLNHRISSAGNLGALFTVDFRRFIDDDLPRVTNISGIEVVILPRSAVRGFDATAKLIRERISKRKRRLPGLPAIVSQFTVMMMLPHALLRFVIPLWTKWSTALVNRGLLVTNIGALDSYLDSFGDHVVDATVFGPFLPGFNMPLVTATGFRDRLILNVNGYDGAGRPQMDCLDGHLGDVMDEVGGAS